MKLLVLTLALFLFVPAAYAGASDKWEGFYVGASAVQLKSDLNTEDSSGSGLWFPAGKSLDFDADGFLPGIQSGYQRTVGNFLYGVEASMILGSARDRVHSPWIGWHNYKMSIQNQTLLGVRVGYILDDWLVFAKGGYAGGKVEFKGEDMNFPNYYRQSSWQNGWHAGAGIEYLLTEHVVMGVDYTHTDLGLDTAAGAGVPSNEKFKLDAKTDTFALRLNYKF